MEQQIADDARHFYVRDGRILKNLQELRAHLKGEMSDETFSYHCNSEKNDFANWIRDVIGDRKLATRIKRVRTRKTMLRKLGKR